MDRWTTSTLTRALGAVACVLLAGTLLVRAQVPTPAPDKAILTFGVIADVQYRDADPQGARMYRESLARLQDAVSELNRRRPAFTVQLGDAIDGQFASYERILPVFAQLEAPVYHVLGNHDFAVEQVRLSDVIERLGLDRLGEGKGYYDFVRAGWRFIVLNGNDLSVLAHPAGSPERARSEAMLQDLKQAGGKNAEIWNGGIGPAQIDWLKRTLDAAAVARERVLVLCHFPLYPPNPATLWNDGEILDILEVHPEVVAYFCGHKHEGDYAERNAVHYVNFQGMVQGNDTAWALVEVYEGSLKITGFGREPTRTLALR
jgi:manganese-dependent ADP-ribose/CDP-alcohol diphosphatase